jgi:hypothetical protein
MNGMICRIVYFFITLLVGICVLYPYLDYQPVLAQGDHGRDLYCFKKAMDGDMVYRDYWWLYGPIMPYYYSLFYKAFGINIKSVLLGRNILILLCGLITYRIMSLYTTPLLSFSCAFAFWEYYPDFCHTYAYTGGVTLILLIMYLLFLYIRRPRKSYLSLITASLVLLTLVKLNTGTLAFIAFVLSLLIRDSLNGGFKELQHHGRLYYIMAIIFGFAVIVTYLPFLYGLSGDMLAQSFTWSASKRMFTMHPPDAFRLFADVIVQRCRSDMRYLAFSVIFVFGGIMLFLRFMQKSDPGINRREAGAVILSLLTFSLFDLHEYFLSGAVYMLGWGFPTLFLLAVIILSLGISNSNRGIRYGISAIIVALTLSSFISDIKVIRSHKTPANYLDYARGRIYVNNPPEWFETVRKTTDFLMENAGANERIIAIPYDTLYCYLSMRDSAIRQQEMFLFGHPSLKQEREIISRMEQYKVKWVVFSNRYRSKEQPEFGTFGKTHCALLYQYITKNCAPVRIIGPWEKDPDDWIRDHAVMILKRSHG